MQEQNTGEWFEERFWIWVHYGAAKIARRECSVA